MIRQLEEAALFVFTPFFIAQGGQEQRQSTSGGHWMHSCNGKDEGRRHKQQSSYCLSKWSFGCQVWTVQPEADAVVDVLAEVVKEEGIGKRRPNFKTIMYTKV
jgi:hypothetical protein